MRRRWFAPPPLGGRQLWIMAEIAEISDWKMRHQSSSTWRARFRPKWRDSRTGVYFALDSVSKKRDVTHARIDAAVPKSSARASTRHTRRRLAQDEHQHDVLHGRHDLGDAHGGRPPQRPRDSRRGGRPPWASPWTWRPWRTSCWCSSCASRRRVWRADANAELFGTAAYILARDVALFRPRGARN